MSNCFGREKKMNEKCNKCWSLNDEDFFDDWCDLIDELEQEELGVGTEFFEAVAAKFGVQKSTMNCILWNKCNWYKRLI